MKEDKMELNLRVPKNINWKWVFLCLFLFLGLFIRVYHLNYPTIGYHNMKENEYLDEAYFFETEGNLLHKQAFFFNGLDEKTGYHEEYSEVPYVAYLTAGLWVIFGENIWLIRFFMILFMLGSILLTYTITKQLTKNEYLAILSSFLITIMPLGIYFGRSIQPESPGLFFILLTAFFFIKWLDTKERKNLIYSGFAFSVAIGLKYTFGIIAVPLFFIIPFKEFIEKFKHHRKDFLNDVKYLFYGVLPGVITTIVYESTVVDRTNVGYNIDFLRVFDWQYWSARWPSLMSYFNDNYTVWFLWLTLIGIIFVLLKYRTRFSKFLIGYVFSIFIYADVMAAKIGGHSYYQMPFLPLVCILSAYALFSIGFLLKQIFKTNYAVYVPLILIVLAIPSSISGQNSIQAANDRVWGTNFYGQDFLGEYLKTRLEPSERFFAFTHAQDLATCSYAKHRCGGVATLEEFKHKESVFNMRYVYVGATQFSSLFGNTPDPLWDYIKQNYKIDLIGLMNINEQLTPMHVILKKGGKFNLNDVQNKQPQLAKTYDTKQGQVPYYFIQNI